MKTSKFYILILTLVFSSIVFTAFNKAVAADAKLRSEIEAANAEWAKQYNAGNAAGVTALYTDDAKAMPPNSDFVTGKAGITAVWQGMMDSGAISGKLTTVEVMGSGDSAIEVGTYEVMDKDGKTVDKGKYMVHWKKVGSTWKLHRDIWNSSMPAAPAK
jgi:uncharacterized protein (TIGR02246 family)